MINEVDFIITTFDRYELLKQLLDSIFKFYPYAKVTIADQSKEIDVEFYNRYYDRDLRVLPLPYDCGLSKARNILVKETGEKYKLLLEDDFLFTEDTKIEKLVRLTDIADIVGGAVYNRFGNRLPFEFRFKKENDTIYQIPDENKWDKYLGVNYKDTGCVMNFILFKSIVFNDILWYDKLKLCEHQHFFFRVKNPIVFTNDVKIVDNKREKTPEYKKLRNRNFYWKYALEDLGVKRLKYLNGQVVEIDGDKVITYREKNINLEITK